MKSNGISQKYNFLKQDLSNFYKFFIKAKPFYYIKALHEFKTIKRLKEKTYIKTMCSHLQHQIVCIWRRAVILNNKIIIFMCIGMRYEGRINLIDYSIGKKSCVVEKKKKKKNWRQNIALSVWLELNTNKQTNNPYLLIYNVIETTLNQCRKYFM